jgi:hypothetical protein
MNGPSNNTAESLLGQFRHVSHKPLWPLVLLMSVWVLLEDGIKDGQVRFSHFISDLPA